MRPPPRVLLCGRPDLLHKPGGDTLQVLSLQRRLDRVRLALQLRPALEDVDLVHVFNLSRPVEPAAQAAWARRHGRPVVCTTIYQDLREYNRAGRVGAGHLVYRALGKRDGRLETARALVNLWRAGPASLGGGLPELGRAALGRGPGIGPALQARLLENSDLLVFNSRLEEETVQRCVPGASPRQPSVVVPVGIDPAELTSVSPEPFLHRYRLDPGFVLCVGRIEDLKNQLGLIRALRDLDLQLVLVGRPNPAHRGYGRAVERAAARRRRTLLLRRLERSMVLSAMAAAAVHVLPSWFETAGMVSLEAAALGCAVVSTDRGYARAFLGRDACYCDPGDPGSIRAAVLDALASGPSPALRQRVLGEHDDARIARQMGEIYGQVAG